MSSDNILDILDSIEYVIKINSTCLALLLKIIFLLLF